MSTPKLTVEVQGISKMYRLGSIGTTSLRDSFARWFGGQDSSEESDPAKRPSPQHGSEPGTFWSLRDISFDAAPGQVVGIVGRNGAGKSTLLKILSRITEPTEGRAILRGRVASLLEVGTGFHPELTGRENIFLNGAILGMKRAEITAKFDEIVEFSEVGTFIDTPVKRYSSGMHVRLAFAVAAHLEPEILLVDEVLAVGDASFQKKCLGKMSDVASKQGRTVFFVSHNMGAVRALCDRAVLIEHGRLVMNGSPADIVSRYLADPDFLVASSGGETHWQGEDRPQAPEIALNRIRMIDEANVVRDVFEAGQPFRVEVSFEMRQRVRGGRFNIFVTTSEGEVAFVATDHNYQFETLEPGEYRTVCHIPGGLLNRRKYRLGLHFGVPGQGMILDTADYLGVTIAGAGNQATHFPDDSWPGAVCPKIEWTVERV